MPATGFSSGTKSPNVHDYNSAAKYLAGGRDKFRRPLPGRATYICKARDGRSTDICVVYHQTAIVTYHQNGSITLDTGGWNSVTTRNKMSEYLPRANYAVFSCEGVLCISRGGWGDLRKVWTFDRTVTITASGEVVTDSTERPPEEIKRLMKLTNEYSKRYIAQLVDCEIAFSYTEKPAPDAREVERLLALPEDKAEYPAGLLSAAIDEFGYPFMPSVTDYYIKGGVGNPPSKTSIAAVQRCIRRYMRRVLGLECSR